MKYLIPLILISFTLNAKANNFLQVYTAGENEYVISRCNSNNNKNTCVIRTTSISDACILESKIFVYNDEQLKVSKNGLEWTINDTAVKNGCSVTTIQKITGSKLITQFIKVENCPELFSKLQGMEVSYKRLKIGLNPVLSTKNCKSLVWLY